MKPMNLMPFLKSAAEKAAKPQKGPKKMLPPKAMPPKKVK